MPFGAFHGPLARLAKQSRSRSKLEGVRAWNRMESTGALVQCASNAVELSDPRSSTSKPAQGKLLRASEVKERKRANGASRATDAKLFFWADDRARVKDPKYD